MADIIRRNSDITVGELRYLIGKDDPVIIEVGCNDGETTRQMLAVMPNAKITCFEPDPRPLRRSFIREDRRVTTFQLAISDRYGTRTFNQSGGKVPGSTAPCADDWDYSGSLCKPTGHLERDKLVTFPTTIEVRTQTLDAMAPRVPCIDLLFADVQGAEALLILGGQQTLRKTRWFYCEFYNVEQYERQPDLKGLLSFLPDWDLVGTYANNALFRNRTMETA
jgi:FkbM family methyltransferase